MEATRGLVHSGPYLLFVLVIFWPIGVVATVERLSCI